MKWRFIITELLGDIFYLKSGLFSDWDRSSLLNSHELAEIARLVVFYELAESRSKQNYFSRTDGFFEPKLEG